jgi:hypothetical protein
MKAIGSLYKSEILTADFLDGQYLLIGGPKGLYFIDVKSDASKPQLLIGATSFSQIQVLEDYCVLLAIAGKHSHIRQYKLSSIRKLIRFLTGGNAQQLAQMDLSSPVTVTMTDEPDETSLDQSRAGEYESLHPVSNKDDTVLVTQWSTDYIKIPGTRDTKECFVQRTATSIFMLALVRQDLILHQWAAEPYSKFMKLKAFWLPEKPKFINLFHDGITVREICLGYRNEANLVIVDDSKVVDIFTHREFTGDSWKSRWRTFDQIPFSASKEQELKDFSSAMVTVNRKLLAASGPTLKRPMNHEVDRFFLATYDRITRVTDIQGQPLVGSGAGGWTDGVKWDETLNSAILRPMENVIGVSNGMIQVFDWNTAQCQQTVTFPGSTTLRVLSERQGGIMVLAERKRKPPVLYWVKEPTEPLTKKLDPVKTPVKLLSPSMANLHLDEKSGLGFGMRDANAINSPSTVTDYKSQQIAFQGGRTPAMSPSVSPASSRNGTPPMTTDEYIRMRQQQQQHQPQSQQGPPSTLQYPASQIQSQQYSSRPPQTGPYRIQPQAIQVRPYAGPPLANMYSPAVGQQAVGSPMIDSMNPTSAQFVRSPMRHSAYFSEVDLSGLRQSPQPGAASQGQQAQIRSSPDMRQPQQPRASQDWGMYSPPQGHPRPVGSPSLYYAPAQNQTRPPPNMQALPPPAMNNVRPGQPGAPFQGIDPQTGRPVMFYPVNMVPSQQTRIIQPGQPIMQYQRPHYGQMAQPQYAYQGNPRPNGQQPQQRPQQPGPSGTPQPPPK